MPDDGDEGDASKPVTHGELPGLIHDALTDFFGDVSAGDLDDDGDGDPAGDSGGNGGEFASMAEIESKLEAMVHSAVEKLSGQKPTKKAAGTKKAAPRPEPEGAPASPRKVDMRRKFWGLSQ